MRLAVIVPATLIAVQSYGAEGAAAARAGVSVLMVPVMMVFTARTGNVSFGQLTGALWRPLAAAVVMAAVVHLLPLAAVGPTFVRLVLKLALCGVLYPAVLMLLWLASGRPQSVEATLVTQVRGLLARRRAS